MITFNSIGAAGIQQGGRSHDIGTDKCLRIRDGTVYMALCCKVYYDVRLFFLEEFKHEVAVCDIAVYKFVIWFVFNRFQCL